MAARAVFSSLISATFRTVSRLTTALAMRSATAAWRGITRSAYTPTTRGVKERTTAALRARRENDRHPRARRLRTLDPDGAAVRLDERLDDGEADTRAVCHARRVRHAIVRLEDAAQCFGRNAAPGIGDFDGDASRQRPRAHPNRAAARRILDRIGDEIRQHALQRVGIGVDD